MEWVRIQKMVVVVGLFHHCLLVQVEIHLKMMALMFAIGPKLQSPNLRTEESRSCNRLSKDGMLESKKGLIRALLSDTLKENFEIHVTRSCTARYEVGCKYPECKFQFRVVKMESGNYWTVQKFEEDHSCTIDNLHNRYR
ncbi:hypothetical protein Ddye_008510 [Dipteronia dyeriana]|uniref:Transposase MuDR plant domain-containing protein n=1 Tax=Dipteronia dyeriana TaxID=168575 RepID=A0AAD9X9X5_9ROSI|nr:hypothetical protein Ddye_008510 [Dipteronia dyeriana]